MSCPRCVAVAWEAELQAASKAFKVGNKGSGLSLSSASCSSLDPCKKVSPSPGYSSLQSCGIGSEIEAMTDCLLPPLIALTK